MSESKVFTSKTMHYIGAVDNQTTSNSYIVSVKYQREKNLQDSKIAALVNMRETLRRKLDTLTSINQDNRWFGMNSDMTALIDFADAHLMDNVSEFLVAVENGYEMINDNLVIALDRLDELIAAAEGVDVRSLSNKG